ncbi:MAG: NAD-dependent epimerase/dehydratase family protein [Acholeplasmataceae bacterium]|nr:NAD-dependent epimerase/dehydratase family protein [Acholeplasmataceae bacterium]
MNSEKKTALVTGATGFIGKHLCRKLIREGWKVHAVVRPSSDCSMLTNFAYGHIDCHTYDGKSDNLCGFMQEVDPQVVFHLASLFLAKHEFKDILPLIQSNITFATQLVEAMIQAGVYNLINTGTSWQHFNNAEYDPVCLYAATKEAFEDILKYYQNTSPLQVITLKLFDTYGPADTRRKLIPLLQRITQTKEQLLMSPGDQYLDLVYIDDVIEAYLLAAEYLINEEYQYVDTYAVTSESPIKLKELVKVYETVSGKKLDIVWGGQPYRDREVMEPWNKGKLLPNWRPKVDIRQGISRLLEN